MLPPKIENYLNKGYSVAAEVPTPVIESRCFVRIRAIDPDDGGERQECADKFSKDFPHIELDADAIFLRDGLFCTVAGVTAGIDLALALIEEDHGRDVAMIVARYMVMFLKRPGGQSQFSAHLVGQMSETTMIQKAQEYVLANLASPLHVDQLAHRIGMSPRNFARFFRREIGMTPGDFVTAARTDAARRLLEDTVLPLQRIASSCGFPDVNAMRRAFAKTIGVSPHQYRSRFHSPPPPRTSSDMRVREVAI